MGAKRKRSKKLESAVWASIKGLLDGARQLAERYENLVTPTPVVAFDGEREFAGLLLAAAVLRQQPALVERRVRRKGTGWCDLWLGPRSTAGLPHEIFLELAFGNRLGDPLPTANALVQDLDYLLNRLPRPPGTPSPPPAGRKWSSERDGRGALSAAESIELPPSGDRRPVRVGLAVAYFDGEPSDCKHLATELLKTRRRVHNSAVCPPHVLAIGAHHLLAVACAVLA